jgi:hydroxymethylpyrimidine pyrophosphatase-like HAD family hydrolase
MANIRLIATDLDGTLIGSTNEFPLYNKFREQVNSLRRENNAVWAACTGRSLRSFRQFFAPMFMMQIVPDFVIVRHAYIYGLSRLSVIPYRPHLIWNIRIRYLLWVNQLCAKDAIDEWYHMIRTAFPQLQSIRKSSTRLRIHLDSEEAASSAAELLTEKAMPYKHLQVFRYLSEVDVMSIPFTKGLALSELAAHIGVPPEHILAVGNGHNDISMMEANVAGMTGCPSNSEVEVMEAVHSRKGHIAEDPALAGVMEIIDAHTQDNIRSELPKDPIERTGRKQPKIRKPSSQKKKREIVSQLLLAAAVAYAVLTVFASFGLVPMSGIIMKPYYMLVRVVQKIWTLF